MIKYLGSKRLLLPVIAQAVASIPQAATVLDLFSGTSRVGHALKSLGYRVFANDLNAYAATLARCYVQSDRTRHLRAVTQLVTEFNAVKGQPGYFTTTFCEEARYFQPKNGERIDAIRESIARKGLGPELESIMLVSLMEAADRVDSTTGVQMAYLKSWAARAHNDLTLRVPDLLERSPHGKGRAYQLDAAKAAASIKADIAYVDPPYNQHSYLGNYHIWESLVLWDKPSAYGIARKRTDCRERKSLFNSRTTFAKALSHVLEALTTPTIILSFSNEGFMTREEMLILLHSLWNATAKVETIEADYKRYVGAQIGIFNPQGKKVGKVSHLTNKEYLFVVRRP